MGWPRRGRWPLIEMLADRPAEEAASVRAGIDVGDPEAMYAELVGLFGAENGWGCVIEPLFGGA